MKEVGTNKVKAIFRQFISLAFNYISLLLARRVADGENFDFFLFAAETFGSWRMELRRELSERVCWQRF